MKTLLIVEDEKMIRQGIKTMVQRSGVPVEVILECNNGETALEVIREHKIDVMFTDIRMPKMDGIELVKQMQSCEHIPLTVAISGYDDFAYAVEMLRNGVREYILKPIEREKIVSILQKLNDELENKKDADQTNQKIGYQQMKHIILDDATTEEELSTVEKQYAEHFYQEPYRVCCQRTQKRDVPAGGEQNYILLEELVENDVFIVPEEKCALLLKNELRDGYVGISSVHEGIRELKQAYEEACDMRKVAFSRNKLQMFYTGEKERIPEKLLADAAKLVEPSVNMQRVQLMGTERLEEIEKSMNQLFFETKNGRIAPEAFEECVKAFLEEVQKTYRNAIGDDEQHIEACKIIWDENCIDTYEEKLMDAIVTVHEKIHSQFDVNKNSQKMKMAVEYIEENYASDLNMAVVSNYISMNYSLFSYSFKQYTGSNFVNFLKDIRMKKAKELLAGTDMKIIEISQEVGYDNEKHFMKIFKAACGVSPSEYRKNMKVE
ncbi:MAG: response regulator [Lachnospiraceae bacterium]|nr:response regulator [Lachnospiraceae bacterium]